MLQHHGHSIIQAVIYQFKKIGNNPFQSSRTRAKKLLQRFEDLGLVVVYSHDIDIDREQRDYYRCEIGRLNDIISELTDKLQVSDTTLASRADRARALFNAGQFTALASLKRNAKVSYAALGFNNIEIGQIQIALGTA